MRAQFFDGFNFSTFKYSIVAIENPDSFFHIQDFSLHPAMHTEACIRGYTCIFGINEEKKLTLQTLFTNNSGMTPPCIDEISPQSFHSPAGDLRYDLRHVLPYTGSLLIANHFLHAYFVPFGFQLPHAFEKVFELTFSCGLFVQVRDRSRDAKRLRLEYAEPLSAGKKLRIRLGGIIGQSEEYGFDEELIAQYMDLSYDTKYLF